MKVILYIIQVVSLFIGLSLMGCNHYLDVKPKDQYLQERVFQNRETIEKAMSGIHLLMISPQLYGNSLTMGALDVMAQYYNGYGGQRIHAFADYIYTDKAAAETFSNIWKQSYASILNINSFIQKLAQSKGVLGEEEKSQLLGEAFGLRALLHFDLLRVFGPIYPEDADQPAIPYNTSPQPNVEPFLRASVVAEKIAADIDTALSLLDKDPIRMGNVNAGLYNMRFNYYAAQALYARLSLYMGKKEKALQFAQKLIDEAVAVFPWTADSLMSRTSIHQDRFFSSEIIFRLVHPTMQQEYLNSFAPSLNESSLLYPFTERLLEIYDGNPLDPRYELNWEYHPVLEGRYPTYIRYKVGRNVGYMPLIRMSEVYLIAAECELDESRSLAYLNELRHHRRLDPLLQGINIDKEIFNAYRREFWGEGQTFFYMKRKFIKEIMDGSWTSGEISLTKEDYIIPIPKSERTQR